MKSTVRPFTFTQLGLVFIASILVASFAIAGPGHGSGGGKGGRFMSFFDTNNDKMVTLDELSSASITRFAKMDADGNNVVNVDEFKEYISERRKLQRLKGFNKIDQDKSGRISLVEYMHFKKQKAERRFLQLDANGDGVVNTEEFAVNRLRRHGGKSGRHGGGRRFFSKLDGNGDGYITRDESVIAWSGWFKRIDNDSDQVVTVEEVMAYRKNRHKR